MEVTGDLDKSIFSKMVKTKDYFEWICERKKEINGISFKGESV